MQLSSRSRSGRRRTAQVELETRPERDGPDPDRDCPGVLGHERIGYAWLTAMRLRDDEYDDGEETGGSD